MRFSLPPDHYENHMIWVDSSLMAPPWVSLVFRVFRHSLEAQPPVQLFWDPVTWVDLMRTVPPWLAVKYPLGCLFRTVDTYFLLCIYILHFYSLQLSFFCSVKSSVKILVSVQLPVQQFGIKIVKLLINYCLIIVQYSYPGSVFQVFWSHYQQLST
jgi:hypothetical protein